jgi:enoyl-CoA hydratase/carnithine racemase
LVGLMERVAPKGLAIRSLKPSGFIAGAEIREFADMTDEQIIAERIGKGLEVLDRLEQLPFPSVALIHGFCLGGGLELALACDVRVVAETATLGLPETTLGILAAAGGIQRLVRAVPQAVAHDILLCGRRISGAEAGAWGLASRVTARGEATATARALAAKLAAGSTPALAATKRLALAAADRESEATASGGPATYGGVAGSLPASSTAVDLAPDAPIPPGVAARLDREWSTWMEIRAGADAQEGLDAFTEKREPRFA